jgi:hypothetical protein
MISWIMAHFQDPFNQIQTDGSLIYINLHISEKGVAFVTIKKANFDHSRIYIYTRTYCFLHLFIILIRSPPGDPWG